MSIDMVGALKGVDTAAPQADLANLAKKMANTPADQAREAAEGFEAVFLNQFVDSMFKGMKTDGLFGGGQGEKMWQSFLTQHIADAFAARGGLGIADMVVAQLTQGTEGSNE